MSNIYYLLILLILYLIYRKIYQTYLPKSIEKYIENLTGANPAPLRITQIPILWFDANDPNANGYPVSPGTPVTNWKNKVGSNSYAQAINGNLDYSGLYPASSQFNTNQSLTNPNIDHAGPPTTILLKSKLTPINGVRMNDGYFNIKNFNLSLTTGITLFVVGFLTINHFHLHLDIWSTFMTILSQTQS
jgi:hypothetical protein